MRTRTRNRFLFLGVALLGVSLHAQAPYQPGAGQLSGQSPGQLGTGQVPKPSIRWQFNVPVRMRDGVTLAADVFLPERTGKYPVILVRTPYGKEGNQAEAIFFAQHGYAVVVEDVRGRFESDGEWYAFRNETDDGDESIDWAAKQPWSNGQVVTMGGSYLAIDQWMAATRLNPHLVALVTLVSPSDLYADTIHLGGAFELGTSLTWSLGTGRRTRLFEELKLVSWPELFRYLPVEWAAGAAGYTPRFYRDWVDHSARDAYWQGMSWREVYPKLGIPVFHVGGWFDIFQVGTLENFEKMVAEAPPAARAAQRLVVGPWAHGAYGPKVGELDFGPQSRVDVREKYLRWLDHYVRGEANGAERDSPVEIFVMGSKEWRNEQSWPPANARPTLYFLHSAGKANSAAGDGALSGGTPEGEAPDRFDYDPSDPVPTRGGGNCCSPQLIPWGPMDQREVEKRQDVLVYSTSPLEEKLEVTGPVEVHLFASSSARDTDWTAKLVDVAPDGSAMSLTDGILRARFRQSFEQSELLEPGKAEEFVIQAGSTSDLFLKGHRIRLEISSSNFPRFSRNTNTGNIPEKDRRFMVAHQTVYHDRARASYVRLPVLTPRP